jgi:hypothetical protein
LLKYRANRLQSGKEQDILSIIMDEVKFFQNWNIAFETRTSLTPSGSPNRSVSRFVAADRDGRKYIAEGFELRKKSRQTAQNVLLEHLAAHRMAGVFPYLRTASGTHGVVTDGCFWQLRHWQEADGAELPRRDPEKFAALCAGILLQMRRISLETTLPMPPNEQFYFAPYLLRLESFAAQKMPVLRRDLQHICSRLDGFLNREKSLPAMFAHGDFHPGNILTCHGELAAVIDWEFTGWKHPGYDLALLLGCLGRDDISWLTGANGAVLQNQLYRAEYMPDAAWEQLTGLIAAVRLGWLGEWIDLGETELAVQEVDFINFLLD